MRLSQCKAKPGFTLFLEGSFTSDKFFLTLDGESICVQPKTGAQAGVVIRSHISNFTQYRSLGTDPMLITNDNAPNEEATIKSISARVPNKLSPTMMAALASQSEPEETSEADAVIPAPLKTKKGKRAAK